MSDSSNSWYSSGFGGVKAEEERRDSQYNGPRRFWLKSGDAADVAFVDDEPVCLYEHTPKVNGQFMNITCIKDMYPDDPVCCEVLGFDTRSYIGYLTVVDFRRWEDKKGVTHEFELKLLGCKLGSLKLLQEKKAGREGRLTNRVYKVRRVGEKDPNVGNDWEYDREIRDQQTFFDRVQYNGKRLADLFKSEKEEDVARLKKTFSLATADGKLVSKVVPFNYFDVLKPRPPRELKDMLLGAKIDKPKYGSGGSGNKSSGGGKEDEVPF